MTDKQLKFISTILKLYCIALYCIVLYCIVLYCIVLYCIVLYCIVLYCIVLQGLPKLVQHLAGYVEVLGTEVESDLTQS